MKKITSKEGENKNKRKVENIFFLLIILIITLVIINTIWKDDKIQNNSDEKNENATGNFDFPKLF